jgi:hypothetical protein
VSVRQGRSARSCQDFLRRVMKISTIMVSVLSRKTEKVGSLKRKTITAAVEACRMHSSGYTKMELS